MKAAILFTILLLCSAQALALTPIEASSMDAQVTIGNGVHFAPSASGVNEAQASLSWYPRDDYLQDVGSIDTDPRAKQTSDAFVFSWERPASDVSFLLRGQVHTRAAVIPIRERIPFPVAHVPSEYGEYLETYDITDQNPKLRQLAWQIVGDTDDSYEAVFRLADWTTTNVEYSLASLGQPAIQSATEVLESREGKCDELTALFISMVRSVGIPARFVAGYAYTNSDQFAQPWGGHGWAEVWFPDVGWVPFDVTYGEYGYLDAGHVKLKIAPDASESSVDYSASGHDFTLQTQPLDIEVTPLRLGSKAGDTLSISLDAPYTEVGFGSAVLILAEVTNRKDYYVATRLDLSKTSNTQLLSDTYENILLRPRETRTIPFLLKIDSNLQRGYRYEFPFALRSRSGEEAQIQIDVRQDSPTYDKSAYTRWLEGEQAEPQAPWSVSCTQDAQVYVGMDVSHTCKLVGASASSLIVCESRCDVIDLDGGQFVLRSGATQEGVSTRKLVAKISGVSVPFYVTSTVASKTDLTIEESTPGSIDIHDTLEVPLEIGYSGGRPSAIVVTLHVGRTQTTERLERVPAKLTFTVPARALKPGENDLVVSIAYKDALGKQQTQETHITVQQTGANWLDTMLYWVDDAGRAIVGLFS